MRGPLRALGALEVLKDTPGQCQVCFPPPPLSGAGQCQWQRLTCPGPSPAAPCPCHSQNPVVLYWDRMVAISPRAAQQGSAGSGGEFGGTRNSSPQPASPQTDRHLWPRGRTGTAPARLTPSSRRPGTPAPTCYSSSGFGEATR